MYKILMIAPTPFFSDRGCHVQIYEQARALQKIGNKVTICTYHVGKNVPGIEIYRIINIPWYKKTEAGPSYHKFYLDFLLLLKSIQVARRMKPDVIHGHLHEGAVIGFIVSRIFKVPLLFDLQGSLIKELKAHKFIKERGVYNILKSVEKFIDHLADIVVTQSVDMVKELKNEFKVKNVYLTLDGVDVEQFKPMITENGLREKFNIPLNKKIIVYLGILSKYQGIDCLLKAVPKVVKKVKNIIFLIMGYPDVEKYTKMAKKLDVSDFVIFTGRIDYKMASAYLSLGNIAVAPKFGDTEADGKVYNYMAMGLPVVASDTPVHRQILDKNAIYSKENNPDSLADGIVELLLNEKLAKTIGREARNRAVENFSWDNVAERLMECYEIISSTRTRNN